MLDYVAGDVYIDVATPVTVSFYSAKRDFNNLLHFYCIIPVDISPKKALGLFPRLIKLYFLAKVN